MIKGTLTSESRESEVFTIEGDAVVLLQGAGAVWLYRSVGDSEFQPVTDASGEVVAFYGSEPDDVMFNAEYTCKSRACKFKFVAETVDEIKFYVSTGW